MAPKLSVIGLGKLGAPMLGVFAKKGFDVVGLDLNLAFVDAINSGMAPVPEPGLQELLDAHKAKYRATTDMKDAIMNSDVSFIIVPTPSNKEGVFINDNVISALKEIGAALKEKNEFHVVVVTSTVLPGSTGGILRETLEQASGKIVGKSIGLCYNPEFIALGSVVRDMLNPDMILIGQSDDKSGEILEQIYRSSTESNPEFQRMNWVNAELCKIAVNTYVTTKISYANMIADMCDHLEGADADVVTDALGADSRIGKKYIKGAIAYGGPCFPRDNRAFSVLGRMLGMRPDLAEATDEINNYQTVRLQKAVMAFSKTGSRIAILGLSYKPNTPVTEESQGLKLATALLEAGFQVSISDPQALQALPDSFVSRARREQAAEAAIRGADVVCIMTPWEEYKNLPADVISDVRVIIDPWRVIDPKLVPGTVQLIRLGVGDWRHKTLRSASEAVAAAE